LKQEKQEKQEQFQEKQEKQDLVLKETTKNSEIILSEAEEKINKLIQSGMRYNEITKVGFNIVGKGFHRFPISEISKIKKRLNSQIENVHTIDNNKNESVAYVFQLIEKGLEAVDIVIKYRLDPDFVQSCFRKRWELEGYSKDFIKDVFQTFKEHDFECILEDDLFRIMSEALESHGFLNTLKYRCCECRNFVYLSPFRNKEHHDDCMEDWRSAIGYLSQNNGHYYCV